MTTAARTVLHVLPGLDTGGIEALAFGLIEHAPPGTTSWLLNTRAHRQTHRPLVDQLQAEQRLFYAQTSSGDGPLLAWQTWRLCRRIRPAGLVLYAFQRPMLWVALAALGAGVPRSLLHLGNTAPSSPKGRRLWRRLLRLFTLLGVRPVPCSRAIVQSFGTPPPSSLAGAPIVANGCDVTAIRARVMAARAARAAGDPRRVVMVARLDAIKDQATLLRAFAASGIQQRGWQLWLVGDGEARLWLEALARDLGLDPAGIFLRTRADVPDLLGRADLFAFSTSDREGFGIALIEAMAAGLPILASDVPACREVLQEGAAGELLPVGDVSSWSAALRWMADDPAARYQQASRASAAAQDYDFSVLTPRWAGLLRAMTEPSE